MSAPPQAGPFYVSANPESPVAICTLSSSDLLARVGTSHIAARVAIIGPLETENIGIERMVSTLLARPRIRALILCGDEARGRYQSQALQSLLASGVDAEGRIRGARGRRARVPSLTPELLDHLRQQITLYDLTGTHDLDAIAAAVDAALAATPGPYAAPVTLPAPEAIVVPAQRFRLREQDPAGYFVIALDHDGRQLIVDHYAPEGTLAHRLAGPDAESLSVALVEWRLVTRLDHAAYLGRELMKAEVALRTGSPYRQDDPLSLP